MAAQISVHDGPPGRGEDCSHRMQVVGYLSGPRSDGLDCDRPLRRVCRDCRAPGKPWACRNHRQSKCRPCAARYRRRVQRVAASGTGAEGSYLYLLTFTAPGDRRHGYRPRTDSWCPCTPEAGVELADWNPGHSGCWNRLRLALTRRDGCERFDYMRAVEVQDRGALHDHVLVRTDVPMTVAQLRPLAIRAGYGHEVDVTPLVPGSRRAASYVAKYVTKSCDLRDEVPWLVERVDQGTGEITEHTAATFRTWASSARWGLSMATVRAEALAYVETLAARAHERVVADVLATLGGQVVAGPAPPG